MSQTSHLTVTKFCILSVHKWFYQRNFIVLSQVKSLDHTSDPSITFLDTDAFLFVLKGLKIFEFDADDGKVFVSCQGDRGRKTTDSIIQINGLFAEKLGLKDGDQVGDIWSVSMVIYP